MRGREGLKRDCQREREREREREKGGGGGRERERETWIVSDPARPVL